jgi:hypothetical protein
LGEQAVNVAAVARETVAYDALITVALDCRYGPAARNLSHHMTFPQSAHTWAGDGSPGGEYRNNGGCQSCSPASHNVPNR